MWKLNLSQPVASSSETPETLRFARFEFDPLLLFLRCDGQRLALRPKPARLLALLLEHAGQVVTREQIRQALWGRHITVDFERGINTCVRQVREVLDDSAEDQRFIQTLAGEGYRFVAPVYRASQDLSAEKTATATFAVAAPRTRRRFLATIGGLAIVAILSVVGGRKALDTPTLSTRPTDPPISVVVADFETHTQQPLDAKALSLAFRRSLEMSPRTHVLSEASLQNALRRMLKPPDSTIDREVGLLVCRREGAAALVAASLLQLGNKFTVGAEVIDASTGATRFAHHVPVEAEDRILIALEETAQAVRRHLGEAPPRPQAALFPGTTSSLAALQAYTLGLEREDQGRAEEALALFEHAAGIDPAFATARAKLGLAYHYRARFRDSSREIRQALQLRDGLTPYEDLALTGLVATLQGHGATAQQTWSKMISLFPEQINPRHNLAVALMDFGNRFAEADAIYRQILERSPGTVRMPVFGTNFASCQGALGRLDLALQLFEQLAGRVPGYDKGRLGHILSLQAIGRAAEAEELLARSSIRENEGFDIALRLIHATVLIDAGKSRSALTLADRAAALATRLEAHAGRIAARFVSLAVLEHLEDHEALHRGLEETLDELLALDDEDPLVRSFSPFQALALLGVHEVRAGRLERADRIRQLLPDSSEGARTWRAYAELLDAERSLAGGQAHLAVERLRRLVEPTAIDPYPLHVHASLARALRASGDTAAADSVLRELRQHRGRALFECLGGHCFDRPLNILALAAATSGSS